MEIPSESVDQSHPLALSKSNQSANNLQLRIIDPTMTMTTNGMEGRESGHLIKIQQNTSFSNDPQSAG